MFLYVGAQFAGLLLCLVGAPIAWILFYMTPEIRALRLAGAMDAMKLSASYVQQNLGLILGLVIVDWLLLAVGGSIAYVGIFLTMPMVTLSWATHLRRVRPMLTDMAVQRGMLPDHQAGAGY